MFERLAQLGAVLAERAASRRRGRVAVAMAAAAPGGVRVTIEGEAVVLSGRRLRRRYALDPVLRSLAEHRR